MMAPRLALILLCVASTLGLPRMASAALITGDIITVDGLIDIGLTGGPITLTGDHGFTLSGFVNVGSAQQDFVPALCSFSSGILGTVCIPGSTFSLHGDWHSTDTDEMGITAATFDGLNYSNLAFGNAGASVVPTVNGSFVFPDYTENPEITIVSPFIFTGLWSYDPDWTLGSNGPLGPIQGTFAGDGTATLTFLHVNNGFAEGYAYRSARYEFGPTPVPEPASLLLLGTGIVGAAMARRRRT